MDRANNKIDVSVKAQLGGKKKKKKRKKGKKRRKKEGKKKNLEKPDRIH